MTYQPPRRVVPIRSTDRLEGRLRRLDLSGADLARATGLSRQMVSRLRIGRGQRVRLETALAIETALTVKHGYLFDYSEHERAEAS